MSEHAKVLHGDEGDPESLPTAVILGAGTLLLVAIVLFLQGLFEAQNRKEFERKVVAEVPQELRDLRAAQLQVLNSYRTVDPAAGVVAIPVERAIELLIEESKRPGAVTTP